VRGGGRRRWIVDPIDGTRNFARGIPIWATLVALEEDGEMRVGVVSAPALGRRWWAERGSGAFADGDAIRVSSVGRIEEAVLCLQLEAAPAELVARCWHARSFGDFWAHMLVAEGAVDGAVDAVGVSLWDMAAVQVIVEEAGGRFSDLDGVARPDGRGGVTSNGLLHDELLRGVGLA
jgi:histidinol-phosphatase